MTRGPITQPRYWHASFVDSLTDEQLGRLLRSDCDRARAELEKFGGRVGALRLDVVYSAEYLP